MKRLSFKVRVSRFIDDVKSFLAAILVVSLFLAFIIGLISLKMNIWNECRSDHSFMYCWAVLGSH